MNRIQVITDFVKQSMDQEKHAVSLIAHGFKHVDRVRRWALHIARQEGYVDLEWVEAAALLHDIGLTCLEVSQRSQHARVGAEIAAKFLRQQQLFKDEEIEIIAAAIRCHSSPYGGGGTLGAILRDADKLDALGAVGIMRAFTSKYNYPAYDPQHVKGDTWQIGARDFDQRFAAGMGIGDHIIDQINFQCSFYDGISTETAKQIGQPLVAVMHAFIEQLEAEINKL